MSDENEVPDLDDELREAMQRVEGKGHSKPFTMSHVLSITHRKMMKDLNKSIDITYTRIKDFDGIQDKSTEIFMTLAKLHELRSMLDEFHTINAEYFRRKKRQRTNSSPERSESTGLQPPPETD